MEVLRPEGFPLRNNIEDAGAREDGVVSEETDADPVVASLDVLRDDNVVVSLCTKKDVGYTKHKRGLLGMARCGMRFERVGEGAVKCTHFLCRLFFGGGGGWSQVVVVSVVAACDHGIYSYTQEYISLARKYQYGIFMYCGWMAVRVERAV